MYSIYIVNNDTDMMGFEQPVQVPEETQQEVPSANNYDNQSETNLPAIPEMNAETSVTNNDLYTPVSKNLIYGISAGILVLLILIIVIVKTLRKKNNRQTSNKSYNKNSIVDEIFDSNFKNSNKNFATPENIKKCIRLFLENTRIR